MSVVQYAFNPGNTLETISENVGNPNSSALIELNINIASTGVTDAGLASGTTRAITKQEVLQALLIFTEQIVRDTSGKLA